MGGRAILKQVYKRELIMTKKSAFGKEFKRVKDIERATEVQRRKAMSDQEKLQEDLKEEKQREMWDAEEEKQRRKEEAADDAKQAAEDAAEYQELKAITKRQWKRRFDPEAEEGHEKKMPTLAEINAACGEDFLETFVLFMAGFDQATEDQRDQKDREVWNALHKLLPYLESVVEEMVVRKI